MTTPIDRRTFLGHAAGFGIAAALTPAATAFSRQDQDGAPLRYAAVGVGGMGAADLGRIASHPNVRVVAMCDIDSRKFGPAKEKLGEQATEVRTFADYRAMFEEMGDEIDAVSVSTPDHMHAAISMEAMRRGMHVYCQKPLTRTVAEARAMAKRASESGVVTQMGIQNHSMVPLNRARMLFEEDHIGPVHSAYVWTDRPAGWWAQGVERPEGSDDVPGEVDWDLWLGVAPKRPYLEGKYHPFQWRGREDFGTGAQGDMACHLMDPAVWFLGLGLPSRIRSEGPPPNGESYPLWSRVRYEFAPTEQTNRGPLVLTWLDGKRKPPVDVLGELGTTREDLPANACLFVGEKGALVANPYGEPLLLPKEEFAEVEIPGAEAKDHWHEWVDACRGEGECSASFDYAAKLTEIALLGNVALRYPHETLEYAAEEMRFENREEANRWLYPDVREGWTIDGM